jgi:hypothetical protein
MFSGDRIAACLACSSTIAARSLSLLGFHLLD